MLKEVYGEPFQLQAEKYSDKSLFRRLREKTTKLLVKTERLGSSGVRSKKIAEVHEMIVSVPSGKLASGGVFGHLLRNLAESFVDNVLREPVLPMRGCVVYCDLAFGIAEHSGVYVGGRTIVHLDGSGRIEAVSPERFLDRLDGFNSAISIYISCAGDFASGDERTARRAESMVGSRRDYNVLTDNCHRFVYGCLSGDFDNTCSSMETLKLATARRLGTNTWRVWEKSDCEFV